MATARMTLFKPVFLDQRITLKPSEFAEAAADMDAHLVAKIRKDLEGQCCTHGYVRPGSTQILARSMGTAEHCRFTADFLFLCKIRILCLLPYADQVVEARILKVNKLGAYALIVDEGRLHEAVRILVPRDYHLGNQEFDALKEKQGIRVKILKSRFQAKDSFIHTVGVFEGLAPAADEVEGAVVEDALTAAISRLPPAVADTEATLPKAEGAAAGEEEAATAAEAPGPNLVKSARNLLVAAFAPKPAAAKEEVAVPAAP